MKKSIAIGGMVLLTSVYVAAQENQETAEKYKKPVQQGVQTDFLMSYYTQEGEHSAVLGGKGSEELKDITPTVIVSVPLNDDDVLTVDAGIDIYTSASSSNINPYDGEGNIWMETSGASEGDTRGHVDLSYAHSSDDRNFIWSANAGFSSEFDYTSIGLGAGVTRLFNDKATEIGLKGQVYLDTWKELLPIEFRNNPVNTFNPLSGVDRQTYALTASYSQIINPKFQVSVNADWIYQSGLLSTPFNRVYFMDNPNLADWDGSTFIEASDIEHLPDLRMKLPIGVRGNYYLSDTFTVRTYYRFYTDDWGITAHTANIEIPIKLSPTFTVYPMYRYYTQTKADYFYEFGQISGNEEYYTSDYDLSEFTSHQYGAGLRIAPPLGIFKYRLPYGKTTRRLKSFDLRYNYYDREDGLSANIVTFGLSFGL